jgi:hypothetical protein
MEVLGGSLLDAFDGQIILGKATGTVRVVVGMGVGG